MKPMFLAGILLITVGVLSLGYTGVSYTHREKVADIGSVHITADKKETIEYTPILGTLAVAAGVACLYSAKWRV